MEKEEALKDKPRVFIPPVDDGFSIICEAVERAGGVPSFNGSYDLYILPNTWEAKYNWPIFEWASYSCLRAKPVLAFGYGFEHLIKIGMFEGAGATEITELFMERTKNTVIEIQNDKSPWTRGLKGQKIPAFYDFFYGRRRFVKHKTRRAIEPVASNGDSVIAVSYGKILGFTFTPDFNSGNGVLKKLLRNGIKMAQEAMDREAEEKEKKNEENEDSSK